MSSASKRRRPSSWARVCLVLACLGASIPATTGRADEVKIAVAANFSEAAKEIGTLFERASGHEAVFSFGSTGQLYAQISQQAPFEVFLAADRSRPEKAIGEGLAVAGSRFTYASGKIALFSSDEHLVEGRHTLEAGSFAKIAIANPVTAPYGSAALETLRVLGVYDALRSKIVQGNNIAQTYQFVATGNAELGFVALSQIAGHRGGSRWVVPEKLYAPIDQDAVLLVRGEGNEAARAFLLFLRGTQAQAVKEKYGYGAGD